MSAAMAFIAATWRGTWEDRVPANNEVANRRRGIGEGRTESCAIRAAWTTEEALMRKWRPNELQLTNWQGGAYQIAG